MTVYSIQRDWGPNVSIVRIVTDSAPEEVVATGWLGTQADSIAQANNGDFEWKTNDVLLINFIQPVTLLSIASQFFYVFSDFLSVNPMNPVYPNLQNITAHAGGGQTDATQLNIGINVVTVVATAGDSVKLPDDVLGQTVIVTNRTANACDVFPSLGDSINALAANTALSVAGGATTVFYGTSTTRWNSK